MCDINVNEEPVSISSMTGVLHTLIVHTYGFTLSLCSVLVLYKFNACRIVTQVCISGCSKFATKLVFAVVALQTFANCLCLSHV